MDPMGFWESILFTLMVVSGYAVVGWAVANIHPRYDTEQNLALKCAVATVWPIIIIVTGARGLYVFMCRVYRDAVRLIPRKPAVRIPKRVTVEMLAADRGNEYVAGQWANDA